jgi:hypothetical protein
VNEIILRAGFRALLVAPLVRGEDVVGMCLHQRGKAGDVRKYRSDFAALPAQAVREPARSLDCQALGEVSQAVNSTLDLETVLSTIVAKAADRSVT